MKLKLVKLTSGEEIIGEMVDNDRYVLKNCLAIVLQPSKEGITYGFMPWGNLSKDDKVISNAHIICKSVPTDEVLNSYNSMFGGIVTPVKQLIT